MKLRRTCAWAAAFFIAGSVCVSGAPGQELLRTADDQRQMWEERVVTALEAEQTSRLALAEAEAYYSRGRSRSSLRGEERATALERVETLREQHRSALETLEALPEEARRAGALPGWLREAESRFAEGDEGPADEPAAIPEDEETTTAPPASAESAADGADSTR